MNPGRSYIISRTPTSHKDSSV